MKTMTIWQRLHTTLVALIVLLLIGVGVAWWVENTRSKTQARSDQLMNAGDRLRRAIVHLGDCLRWRAQPDTRLEQKKRIEELKADIAATTDLIRASYSDYPSVLEAAKDLADYATKLADAFDKAVKEPVGGDAGSPHLAASPAVQQLLKQQKDLFDNFNAKVQEAWTAERGKSPTAAMIGGVVLLVILVGCICVGRLQAKAVNRPLSLLVETLERMRRGDFTQKVNLAGRDEFGILGEGLNRLGHDLSAVVGQVQRSGIQVNTTAKPSPYSPAFSASMAALSESRLVWSATLVMVVTTELMLLVFSLSTASLAVIEPEASMIWRMVASMRAMALWPLPARVAVSSATTFTSCIVLTSSFEVAEISLDVAPI